MEELKRLYANQGQPHEWKDPEYKPNSEGQGNLTEKLSLLIILTSTCTSNCKKFAFVEIILISNFEAVVVVDMKSTVLCELCSIAV